MILRALEVSEGSRFLCVVRYWCGEVTWGVGDAWVVAVGQEKHSNGESCGKVLRRGGCIAKSMTR